MRVERAKNYQDMRNSKGQVRGHMENQIQNRDQHLSQRILMNKGQGHLKDQVRGH